MPESPSRLAILGGTPAVPPDTKFRMWPEVGSDDEAAVLASLRQDQHASGPNVRGLQEDFAAWNGNRLCLVTGSGTGALHMCVAGCGVEAGDEVITTALSWTSSATCIIHHQAIPVFVDVDWETMLIDPTKIEAAITEKTKAILVVHYFGIVCDMDPILEIAKRHGLAVIEDACQSVGSLYKGRKAGTLGTAAGFSLNQNKNFTAGEGGIFVTDDEDVFRRGKAVTSFSDMRPPEAGRDYDDYGLGWMYRMSDLVAAFGISQLKKLDKTNGQARDNWFRMREMLAGTPNLVEPYSTEERPTNGYAYVLRVDPDYAKARDVGLRKMTQGIVAALKAEGVNVSIANWLLPAHAVFQAKNAFGKGIPWSSGVARQDVDYSLDQFPVAQQCIDTCLWGVYNHRPPNGQKQIDALSGAIRKVFENLDEVPVEA